MAGKGKAFVVCRKEAQLLVPAKPTPHEIKQLSDLDDQKGLRFHFPMIKFYKANPLMGAKDPVETIRKALAEALVWYYPFAGRLIDGPKDKLMVDCNAEGILFIEANCNFSMEEIGEAIKPPCLYFKELLYQVHGSDQMLGCPLMLVQVTRLSCGAFVVAIRVNHVVTDGLGLVQFLNAVGELAQGASSPSTKPVWRRELLTAKLLPLSTTYDHPEYHENNSSSDDDAATVGQSFFFGPREIRSIRQKLPPHARQTSKFDLITACIWRCRTLALKLNQTEQIKDAEIESPNHLTSPISIACMVNISNKSPLSSVNGYYGNSTVSPAAETEAKTLCENPLEYAIELLEKAKGRVNEDYIRSAVNVMELKGRPPILRSTSNFVVSDTSRLGFDKVDFGWGKPVYGGTADGGSATNSIYARYRNSHGVDGVVVPIFLPPMAMERFQQELKRLTTLDHTEFSETSSSFRRSTL